MAISPPRTLRHSRSERAVNLLEDDSVVRDASPLTPPAEAKPISASDSIVFPLPDSPTNPSDSPALMRSDTSFTGPHPASRRGQLHSELRANRSCGHLRDEIGKVKLVIGGDCRRKILSPHLLDNGMTNFSAVCVAEKPTTFTSFRPVLRPATRTSFSVMCGWPLGYTIQRAAAPRMAFAIFDKAAKSSFESAAKNMHSVSPVTFL